MHPIAVRKTLDIRHIVNKALVSSYDFLSEHFLEQLFTASIKFTPFSSSMRYEVSVVLSSDYKIQKLNAKYRAKDIPTNVLSFPLHDTKSFDTFSEGELILLGDIVLSMETTQREAVAHGVSLEAHTAHLFIHGFLHLLGYEHAQDEEAEHMEKIETQCLHYLGYEDPYRRTTHA